MLAFLNVVSWIAITSGLVDFSDRSALHLSNRSLTVGNLLSNICLISQSGVITLNRAFKSGGDRLDRALTREVCHSH